MKSQIPLPNPPDEYRKKYMFDLCSIVVKNSQDSVKVDQDNVFDKGTIIMKSPNGSYFKIVVADNGTLSATAVVTVDNRPLISKNPYV